MTRFSILALLCVALGLAACERGTGVETTEPRSRIVLSADSITLAGPTCAAEVSLSGVAREEFGGWSIEGTDVLGFGTLEARTGTTSWMYRGLVGRTPGTARVIATDAAGASTSLRVRVLSTHRPHVAFVKDTTRVVVGDTTWLVVRVSGQCGGYPGNPYLETTLVSDTSRTNTYASDPDVLRMLTHRHPSKPMVGLKPGTVRVITKYWGAQDTAVVVVQ